MKPSGKIKVAIVINDFLVGGAQKLIADQLKFFDRDTFDISLVTLFEFPGKATFYHSIPQDIPVYRLSFHNSRDIRSWKMLNSMLKKLGPHVVVSHLFFANTAVRILKLFRRYSCITVEHNTYIRKTTFQMSIDKILSFVTYRIIAVSKTVRDFTVRQERISESKFEVIYNGIDLAEIEQARSTVDPSAVREELGLTDSSRLFINVGRLTNQKNHTLLIEAFALFSKTHPNTILCILGEGTLKEELADQIAVLDMKETIRLMGARRDVYSFYALAEAFISTSHIEGLSIAYLESLAFGVPIIATKTAGTDEIITEGRNGYFVEPTVASVQLGIEQFLKNQKVLRSGSLERVKNFDIRKNVKELEAFMVMAQLRKGKIAQIGKRR